MVLGKYHPMKDGRVMCLRVVKNIGNIEEGRVLGILQEAT